MNATQAPRNRRKLVATLSTVLVAGAVAVGSGATFTAQSQNPGNRYEAGTLTQANSLAGASIYDLTNVKPGDTVNGKVTVTNSGSLPATLKLTESDDVNGFSEPGKLRMTVTDVTGATPVVVAGDIQYGDLGTVDLGRWAAGEARTYVFSVTLAASADNSNQGDKASATYTWDSTQETTPTVTNQHH